MMKNFDECEHKALINSENDDSKVLQQTNLHTNRVIDIGKIDSKLREARKILHDTLPFISTYCRFSLQTDSISGCDMTIEANDIHYSDGSTTKKCSFDVIFDDRKTQDEV